MISDILTTCVMRNTNNP